MSRNFLYRFFLTAIAFLAILAGTLQAQINRPIRPPIGSGTPPVYDAQGRVVPATPSQNRGGGDSLKHRDNTDDSITIYFRYFDSTRIRYLDSSINDFTKRYPLPAGFVTLGNLGTAARSLIFSPNLKPGFDPGFHSFDIYRFRVEDTRFFQTTRPFTELGYLLGSQAEQVINIIHTQNIKPNFNMALQYRLINSPGEFQNQNTSHNSYRINGNYQSRNKRYSTYGVLLSNKFLASENGGIQRDTLLNDSRFSNRFVIPTRLAGDSNLLRNPFNTRVTTGNVYNETVFFYRQQYDLGQSDSAIVNDSTVIRLFYPRIRFQHSLTISSQQYEFRDLFQGANKRLDYLRYFGVPIFNDSVVYRDKHRVINNEFSIISFPEKNNLNQFIKAGAGYEFINATFDYAKRKYHNIYLAGEYRNRTRNQKWDLEGIGKLYMNGLNNGDYSVQASLKREISKKLGFLELGFQNVNRSPSFLFRQETTFPTLVNGSFNKENITKISGSLNNEAFRFTLSGEYYLVSNYMYFDDFMSPAQTGTLFNILHISGKKQIRLSRVLNLYSEIHFQQAVGNPPLNLPLIFTNNRISFDGVYYKNMNYSIGLELRYNTPYKADNYSPFIGQFLYQNNYTISNRPEVTAFFNFRIKRFSAFIRAENLNTFGTNTGTPGFTKNNYNAPFYPDKGFWFRLGVWWTFIN
ncbi:putative porin [Segetibacter aerophilus]|uniref:Beta-barrel porin n=1 Tax=Segetibacter aerophilus TaxID=670293 RepID=A0A512BDK1_9BACT|nr:putative porin [Segetibacter aerophilus]GEO10030.1 hypothetical protein SAE01_25260 [Segetibacter aerophilus]